MSMLAAVLSCAWAETACAASTFTVAVSRVTVVTVVSEDGQHPDLLVIWKGPPGWLRGGRSGSAGGSGSGRTFHSTDTFGDVELDVQFDFATRRARIGDLPVSMGADNVVFVERVAGGRWKIGRTLSVEGDLDGSPNVYPLIGHSTEIASYIECDAMLPRPDPIGEFDFCAPLLAEGARITAPAESQVRAALIRYAHLVEKMDHAAIAALFTQDGEIANPGRDPIKGPAAIEAFLMQFSDYHVLSEMMIPQRTHVDGDRAEQEGTFKQRVRGPDGNVIDVSGSFTIDWIRDSSGAWRIQRAATAPAR